MRRTYSSIELCAGGGGQALGLERAGFRHVALVDNDAHACTTLRQNRPRWNVVQADLATFSARPYAGVDLLAAGIPCPPFSKAGHQKGRDDERDLFPAVLRLVAECRPRAVLIENVRGLMDTVFADYRAWISSQLRSLGYEAEWKLLQASDFGVPQLRPRTLCVALPPEVMRHFRWPKPSKATAPTVGEALLDEMTRGGWTGARAWAGRADRIAPTIVGGSKKHGGPDLGPTRARREWGSLGVNGLLIAAAPPPPSFRGMPCLTVRMAAILQGFPPTWEFAGKKTPAYRQVGNAFPPPVAEAVGKAIHRALSRATSVRTVSRQRAEIVSLPLFAKTGTE